MRLADREQVERLASRLTLEPTPEELQQASDALLGLVVELAEAREQIAEAFREVAQARSERRALQREVEKR